MCARRGPGRAQRCPTPRWSRAAAKPCSAMAYIDDGATGHTTPNDPFWRARWGGGGVPNRYAPDDCHVALIMLTFCVVGNQVFLFFF